MTAHNNRKSTACRQRQEVMSEPARVFVESYTYRSKNGKKIKKNRYRHNPNANPVKQIIHQREPKTYGRK